MSLLTEGLDYIYLDSVIRLEHRLSFLTEGEEWQAHNLSARTPGQVTAWTGEADKGNLVIHAEVDDAKGFLCKKFGKRNNRAAYGYSKYLVRQYASETFEQFPDHNLAAKNYVQVIISGVVLIEMEGVKDRKQLTIGCFEFWKYG